MLATRAPPSELTLNAHMHARLLIVDDDASNAALLAHMFDDYDVRTSADGIEALATAGCWRPDLILLDVMMPGVDGFEVCSRLKADPETAGIAVIFITALGDIGAESRGLMLGAVDYVTKPINPALVRARVRNHVELKRARDALAHLAMTDALTDIANRRHFDDVLVREHARLARLGAELSVLMCDVDHFKDYNDRYGHMLGDQCLHAIAQSIEQQMRRPADLAARFGGEEFVCLLPETSLAGATRVAERIRLAVSGLCIHHPRTGQSPVVTISIGVATVACIPGQSVSLAVRQADEQLYLAKSRGRNRVCGGAAAPGPAVSGEHADH